MVTIHAVTFLLAHAGRLMLACTIARKYGVATAKYSLSSNLPFLLRNYGLVKERVEMTFFYYLVQ